jgi:hypothetical protein
MPIFLQANEGKKREQIPTWEVVGVQSLVFFLTGFSVRGIVLGTIENPSHPVSFSSELAKLSCHLLLVPLRKPLDIFFQLFDLPLEPIKLPGNHSDRHGMVSRTGPDFRPE